MLLTSSSEGILLKQGDRVLQVSESEVTIVTGKSLDGSKCQEIDGILGLIELKVGKYLISINRSESVGKILDNEIFKVVSTSVVPLGNYSTYNKDEHAYLDLIRFQLDSSNLYYSPTYDLTNSMQRNFVKNLTVTIGSLDKRFFWNEFLNKDLLNEYAKDKNYGAFITPVISGYAKVLQENVNGSDVSFALVTRRNKFRAGTRYFRRGIDAKGNVANNNETEQLLMYKNTVQSYLQTRGSVPVYWSEINNLKYKPKLAISKTSPVEAATLHFDEQVSLYGDNYLVNLVNQKGYELPVKKAYENIVEKLDNDRLNYIYFDFHHECRKMQWHRVNLLIDRLKDLGMKRNDHFFGTIDKDGVTTLREQSHVVRTNCMDCLDRTNVVQSTLGRYFLQSQLEQLNLLKEGEKWESNKTFNLEFQNFWADNADAVSSVYSGTGALKTDFTRTGKRTRKGALNDLNNSLTRYVKNNYKDGARQDSFDLILGEFVPAKVPYSPFTDNRLYQFRYILKLFLFFIFLLIALFLKSLVYGLQAKQHVLAAIAVVGMLFSAIYMFSNGLQVVDWPKLKPLDYLKKEPVYSKKKFIGNKFTRNTEY
ncbi:phosphatidylinositol-3-phosphatase [Saccharomycopsis crataegensis]|uniref:Phosphatidylinositol-3-phosphatase n=1 Tax=Saccharomycopsis crataegensis TaxID=43959 RepID=A0AAV5QI81_9ASCO|nr:phosphatidylinositol-3-phosphatase [Saccharomycopsis crataegensis]